MNESVKKLLLFCSPFLFLISCSKDDNNGFDNDPFYNNILITANAETLYGSWAIYEAEYNGEVIKIPENYSSCGRNFSMFRSDNTFSDYVIENNNCEYREFRGSWSLKDGILTESISSGESEEIVIIKLTQNQLSMRVRIDVTEDGKPDIVVVNAHRHSPSESNFYDYSFFSAGNIEEGPIVLSWGDYNGIYEFGKYEIYRSNTADCSKVSMTLIGTLNDAQATSFIDNDPSTLETICYYMKIYSVNGLIEETPIQSVYTGDIRPKNVFQNLPSVINQTIELDWNLYDGHYFDHYEITVQNYFDGTGSGYEEEVIATISEREVTNWIDENPPYFKNPVYTIRAVNIFGNKSRVFNQQTISSRETNFKRPEIIELESVRSVTTSPDENSIYLLGKDDTYSDTKIYKYNYEYNEIEAISNTTLNTTSTQGIKLVENSGEPEVFAQSGIREIEVFDGITLESKFTATLLEVYPLHDFIHLRDNLYLFCDDENLYVFSRNGSSFSKVSQQSHFTNPSIGAKFKLLSSGENKVILGYYESNSSIVYDIDSEGLLNNKRTVNVPIKVNYQTNTLYSPMSDYIINFENKQIYNANNFTLVDIFSQPYFPQNISVDGKQVFGSNNNPEWSITEDSAHEKVAVLYDIDSHIIQEHEILGYPLFIFENHLGEIMSISAGTKRKSLFMASPKQNLFVENITQH